MVVLQLFKYINLNDKIILLVLWLGLVVINNVMKP